MKCSWRGVLVLTGLLLLGTACSLRGPEGVRRDLSQAAGVELEREMGITIGRTGMWFARKAMKWAGEDEISQISLKGIKKVQVGVYQVRGIRRGYEEPQSLRLSDLKLSAEWVPLVQVHDDGEDVFVMTRDDDGTIRGLLVVVAEDEEWVVVRVKGKLDKVIESALQYAFDEMDRPELYAATRRERGLDPDEDSADDEIPAVEVDPAL